MVEVRLGLNGASIQARVGEPVIKSIQRAGPPIGFSCRGQGVCTACAVWIEGSASEISDKEKSLLALLDGPDVQLGSQRRIACLAKIHGSMSIRTDYW